jgi:hypothetical protein
MSKQHQPAPVPPGNRPPNSPPRADPAEVPQGSSEQGFQEQDAKRRLGGFETAGEHSRQQPTPLNDGTTHSK